MDSIQLVITKGSNLNCRKFRYDYFCNSDINQDLIVAENIFQFEKLSKGILSEDEVKNIISILDKFQNFSSLCKFAENFKLGMIPYEICKKVNSGIEIDNIFDDDLNDAYNYCKNKQLHKENEEFFKCFFPKLIDSYKKKFKENWIEMIERYFEHLLPGFDLINLDLNELSKFPYLRDYYFDEISRAEDLLKNNKDEVLCIGKIFYLSISAYMVIHHIELEEDVKNFLYSTLCGQFEKHESNLDFKEKFSSKLFFITPIDISSLKNFSLKMIPTHSFSYNN